MARKAQPVRRRPEVGRQGVIPTPQSNTLKSSYGRALGKFGYSFLSVPLAMRVVVLSRVAMT